jgi:hypothetical protein
MWRETNANASTTFPWLTGDVGLRGLCRTGCQEDRLIAASEQVSQREIAPTRVLQMHLDPERAQVSQTPLHDPAIP